MTLTFPDDRSLGTLYLVRDEPRDARPLEARGSVEVPDGYRATLRLAGADVAALRDLRPGALFGLVVTDPPGGLGAELARLQVRSLGLAGSWVAGSLGLGGLGSLEQLSVHGALDADEAAGLTALPDLRSVSVDGGATASGAAALLALTGLETLVLVGQEPLTAALGGLGSLGALRTLALQAPDVDDAAFALFSGLLSLESLTLTGAFTASGLPALQGCTALTRLKLSSPALTRPPVGALAGHAPLGDLTLAGGRFDDGLAVEVSALAPPLRRLTVYPAGSDERPPFSLGTQVWLARTCPDLEVNGSRYSPVALDRLERAGHGPPAAWTAGPLTSTVTEE